MRIFLTGGHGFIGSRVTRALSGRGHTVRLLLREKSKTHRIDDVPFERAKGDVRDKASLVEAMKGMESCIHLASVSSWKDIRSNVLEPTVIDGTKNLLEAAKEAGLKRVVFVSSILAVNASTEPKVFDESSPFELSNTKLRYSLAKHEAEKMVLAAAGNGVETVIVNPGEVYGREDEDFI